MIRRPPRSTLFPYTTTRRFCPGLHDDVPCLSASHAHDSTSEVADDLDGGRMKAGRATRIMVVVVIVAFSFAVVGCASPQEQESPGAAGGENVAEPAREACASRTGAAIPPLSAYGIYDC